MGMKELDRALELIEEDGSGDFEGPKSPELVITAEKRLGLLFPPTYKKFLLEMGCGDIAGLEIYGLINGDFDDSSIPDTVWVTMDERKSCRLPSGLVLVAAGDDGCYYALDIAEAGKDGECPVVKWDSVQARITETISPDFGSFLLEEMESVLEVE